MKQKALIFAAGLLLCSLGVSAQKHDFADFKRYAAANAQLPEPSKKDKRVVFMGNSITDIWASLVNTPVVSVWGATHPYAGFMGWHQSPDNAVQLDMPCRPCSIYGNKPCMRGDFACMKNISPELIVEKVENVLNRK